MQHMESIINKSVALAEKWQNRANELLRKDEKTFQNQMKRLLGNSMDKVVLAKMIDQSFRSKQTGRVADQIISLFKRFGIPSFFSTIERALTQLFLIIGKLFQKESYTDFSNREIHLINRWLKEYAKENRTPVLDLEEQLSNRWGFRKFKYTTPDGSHVTAAGYEKLTAYARPVLLEILSVRHK